MLIPVLTKTSEKYVINKINVVKTNKHTYIQNTIHRASPNAASMKLYNHFPIIYETKEKK